MELPRVPLILAPTPLHRLDRLSDRLGLDLWIKRDDLTGFGGGGNKGRKLEYLLGDALAQGAEVIVTCGALQSNFIRQLAAACAVCGIECAAATMTLPFEFDRPTEPGLAPTGGNVLLNELLGADVRVYPDGTWDELFDHAESLAEEYRAAGKRVLSIPIGGSCARGAYGFVRAGEELQAQADSFDWVIFASSSGSTHTGLQYALHGTQTRVLGVACDPEPDILDDYASLYASLERLIGEPRPVRREDWRLTFDFVGPGYGVPSPAGARATELLARTEGVFLDPVYSAKAFAGLLAMVEAGEIGGRALFWHTGGFPTLFALPNQ